MVLRTPVKIDQPVKSSIFQSKMADLLHNFPRKLPVRFWWFKNHIGSRFLAHSITFRLLWNLYSVSSYSTISDTERAALKICAYHGIFTESSGLHKVSIFGIFVVFFYFFVWKTLTKVFLLIYTLFDWEKKPSKPVWVLRAPTVTVNNSTACYPEISKDITGKRSNYQEMSTFVSVFTQKIEKTTKNTQYRDS